jgi:hypothetical protein
MKKTAQLTAQKSAQRIWLSATKNKIKDRTRVFSLQAQKIIMQIIFEKSNKSE